MHDSSACLIKNNEIVAYAEEERFNREKHTGLFPKNAVDFCLNRAKIEINDIRHVGFSWRPVRHVIYRLIDLYNYFPDVFFKINPKRPSIFMDMLKVKNYFRKKYRYKNKFHFLDHQLCHCASSYYTSPFQRTAILLIEANSERETTLFGMGDNGLITKLKAIRYPNSIGLLYLCVTEYLGFKENSGEGKVMGLAPYGQPTFYNEFKQIIKNSNGQIYLNMDYFDVHLKKETYVTQKFIQLFGPRRRPEDTIEKRHMDVAASLQKITEDICLNLANDLYAISNSENLCLAGGVALNSVMNGKLQKYSKFDNIFIPPMTNDVGTSLGAALYLKAIYNKKTADSFINNFTPYLGPEYSNEEIEHVLRSKKLNYYPSKDICKKIAEELTHGKIIGWFQGRMEVGPRALGNRSILADPRNTQMKDILNYKVKHREGFRPFAPSVLVEKANDYFDTKRLEVPFMLKVFSVRPERKAEIPAVVHADDTARLQTVCKRKNPLYWNLINEFYKLTNCPVILNTSFNVRGEPIVCNPVNAVDCFLKTKIDILAIGDFLVFK